MRAAIAFAILALLSLAETASAQYPSMMDRKPIRADRRPAVSPYFELLNDDRSLESSYFRRVRPELEFRRANENIYRSMGAMQQQMQQQGAMISGLGSGLGATGHSTMFMNTGGYFGTGGGGIGGFGGGGGGGMMKPINNSRGPMNVDLQNDPRDSGRSSPQAPNAGSFQ
jgi:hypothetical protein